MRERPAERDLAAGGPGSAVRNRQILDLRRQGLTLREIGERFGLTRQRVAQIIDAAGGLRVADVVVARNAQIAGIVRSHEIRDRWWAGARSAAGSDPTLVADQQGAQSVAERRASVRELLNRGLPPSQIAVQLETCVYTVYGDLAWLRAVAGQRRSAGRADAVGSRDPIGMHMQRVEARLREVAAGSDRRLEEIVLHLIEAGGKRLRPALVVSSAIAAGGAGAVSSGVVDAAVAVELLHLATLYHDDVLDSAPVRRARPSVNAVWGNRTAVLAGDLLLSRAFCLAAELRFGELRRFCETVGELCSGEIAQTEMQFDHRRDIADYEASIRGKTAALLATSCWLGASLADAPDPVARALGRYGEQLGVAFQIVDDVMDLFADAGVAGKGTGVDLRDGVFTLPLLLSLPHDPRLRELVVEGIDERGIDEVRQRIRRARGDDRAIALATKRVESALACLCGEALDADGRLLLVSIARSVLAPVDRSGLARARS